MSGDRILRAVLPTSQLVVAMAQTTAICRTAQSAQALGSVATIALGRLLTSTALAALTQERLGALSIQILGQGQLGQLFADVTGQGHLRGYVRNASLVLPLLPGERPDRRRSIAHAVSHGTISIIRILDDQNFTQSATPLVWGEIDTDVAHFLENSDQVPTALASDVLLGSDGSVERAGGVLVQAMPGANLERLAELRARIANGGFAVLLAAGNDLHELLKALARDARPVAEPTPIVWHCRCSRERVLAALRMLGPVELADMVQSGENAIVRCDFCARTYLVEPEEVSALYRTLIKQ